MSSDSSEDRGPGAGLEGDRGGQLLAATLAAALGFAAAVMAISALDLADTPLRSELTADELAAGTVESYDGSGFAKTLSTITFFASAAVAAAAVVVSLVVAATRTWNRLLMPLAGAAVALGAVGILINNV